MQIPAAAASKNGTAISSLPSLREAPLFAHREAA